MYVGVIHHAISPAAISRTTPITPDEIAALRMTILRSAHVVLGAGVSSPAQAARLKLTLVVGWRVPHRPLQVNRKRIKVVITYFGGLRDHLNRPPAAKPATVHDNDR